MGLRLESLNFSHDGQQFIFNHCPMAVISFQYYNKIFDDFKPVKLSKLPLQIYEFFTTKFGNKEYQSFQFRFAKKLLIIIHAHSFKNS